MRVRVNPGQLAALRRLPYVNYIEPEHYGTVGSQTTPWNVVTVGAPTVWSTFGNVGQLSTVTILDSGLDSTHLANPSLDGPGGAEVICTSVPVVTYYPSCHTHGGFAHGAFVAGIVAARDNTSGYVGVAPGLARFNSVRVCNTYLVLRPANCFRKSRELRENGVGRRRPAERTRGAIVASDVGIDARDQL
ncbi:MAG: S8 family serine peptidase, partial [Gemmatimonadetes bacterium]|nr:S8 family serine peptidase [Gemmatimonadota bacterium]